MLKFYLFSILSKFFCIFLTFLTLRLEFKAILVIFLVLLTFLIEKLKIRDRKILIFWQSLFIFFYFFLENEFYVIQLQSNGSNMKNSRKQQGILTTSVTERKKTGIGIDKRTQNENDIDTF